MRGHHKRRVYRSHTKGSEEVVAWLDFLLGDGAGWFPEAVGFADVEVPQLHVLLQLR